MNGIGCASSCISTPSTTLICATRTSWRSAPGRGGGASYISRYLQPRSMTGMDFSQAAVDLCNRHRLAPGLAFVCGDALSMPFPASSFDAVVNIESSHCYESMDTFLSEVCRVLRPGGRFFFADLRSMDGVTTLQEQFNACGLTVEKQTDITTNVLTALQLDNCPEARTHRRLDPASRSPAVPGVRRHRRNQELRPAREREVALPERTTGKEQPARPDGSSIQGQTAL